MHCSCSLKHYLFFLWQKFWVISFELPRHEKKIKIDAISYWKSWRSIRGYEHHSVEYIKESIGMNGGLDRRLICCRKGWYYGRQAWSHTARRLNPVEMIDRMSLIFICRCKQEWGTYKRKTVQKISRPRHHKIALKNSWDELGPVTVALTHSRLPIQSFFLSDRSYKGFVVLYSVSNEWQWESPFLCPSSFQYKSLYEQPSQRCLTKQ